jgi:hypothetical protein
MASPMFFPGRLNILRFIGHFEVDEVAPVDPQLAQNWS